MISQSNTQACTTKEGNVHYLIQLQGGPKCTVDILKKVEGKNVILISILVMKFLKVVTFQLNINTYSRRTEII